MDRSTVIVPMNVDRTMTVSQFQARCLAVLDDVADGAGPVTVTKHGRPVARVVPVQGPADLHGSVTFLAADDDLVHEPHQAWDAEVPRARETDGISHRFS